MSVLPFQGGYAQTTSGLLADRLIFSSNSAGSITYSPITTGSGATEWQNGTAITTNAVTNVNITSLTNGSGFTFTYDGASYSSVNISNNGFITFGATAPSVTDYNPIAAATAYAGAIAGYGFNLVASSVSGAAPSILYQVMGTAPNREFVVEYRDVARSGIVGDRMNFQIRLSETSNIIKIVYGTWAATTTTTTASNFGQVGLRGESSADFHTRMVAPSTATNNTTWENSGGGGDAGGTPSQTAVDQAGGINCMRYNNAYLPSTTSTLTFTWTPIASSFYQPLPYTQSFDSWVNLQALRDVPASSGVINWPASGHCSWRNITESYLNSSWNGTNGNFTSPNTQAGTGSAVFNQYNALAGTKGVLDFFLNFSTPGNKVAEFYIRNPAAFVDPNDMLQVYLSTDGGLSFAQIGSNFVAPTPSPSAATWSSKLTLALGSSTSSNCILRFQGVSDWGSTFENLAIDELSVYTLNPCTTPTAQPTSLVLSSVTATSLSGSFAAATPAPTGYIVFRSTSSTPPAPVNGTTYTSAGSPYTFSGNQYTVVNTVGTGPITFSEAALTANMQYYYFVMSVNSSCTGQPFYLTTAPLTNNALTCTAAPATLTGVAASSTSATISFSTVTGATSYVLQYSIAGANSWVTASPAPTGSPYPLTGLLANTGYDIRLQGPNSSCGTLRTTSAAFTTPCASATLPFSQGFNSATIPSCWTQQFVTNSSSIQFVASSSNPATTPQEGSNYVYWNSFSITSGNQTRLVSPPISTIGSPSVNARFYWRHDNTAYTSATYADEGVKLQYSLNGTTWVDVQSINRLLTGTDAWTMYDIALPPAAGNAATMYVGFQFTSRNGNNCALDNLLVYATSPCTTPAAQPGSLVISNVTATSLSGSFAAASPAPSSYIVLRSTSNAAPSPVNGTVYTSAGSPYTFSGNQYTVINTTGTGPFTFTEAALTANTQYYYYVMSVNSTCGGQPFYRTASPLTANVLTCTAAPATLSGTSASAVSANINFGAVTGASTYVLQYSVAGANAWTTASPAPVSSPYTLTGLTPNTAYDIRMQGPNSNCGTLRTTANAFRTPCVSSTLPYTMGFNAAAIPSCWTQQFVTGTSSLQFVASSSSPATSPQEGSFHVMWNSASITNGNQTRLVSAPLTTIGAATVNARFYWVHDNSNYTTAVYADEGVRLQYSLDGTTWVDVQAINRVNGTNGWTMYDITLPPAATNVPMLYVGFLFTSRFGNNCSLDNLLVYVPAPCTTPTDQPAALSLTGVTATSLNGSFTPASPAPSGYIVLRSTSNVAPTLSNGTNYIVGNSYGIAGNTYAVVSMGTSTNFSEVSLTPGTQYYYYVFAYNGSCSGAPFYFNTAPLTANALTCTAAPATLTGTGSSGTSANISFTAVPGAISYLLQYSIAGANAWISASPNPTGSPYVLTGLAPGTSYDIRLSGPNSSCGTTRTTLAAFTTPCATLNLPVSQGFESSNNIPSCWTQQYVVNLKSFSVGSATTAIGTNPNPSAANGSNRLLFPSYTTNGSQTRFYSPAIATTGTSSVDVQFQWYFSALGGATSYLTEGVQVQWSTDGLNWTSAGSLIRRYGATTGWQNQTVTLPSAAGNQPTLYVGFLFTSNAGYDAFIDDILIKATPPCNYAGVASIAAASVCASSGSTTLSATGYSVAGAGLAYQWQFSSDNFVADINDLPSGTNPAFANTGVVTSTRYYRLRTFCTSLGNSYSNVVSFSVGTYSITGTTPGSRCGIGTVTLQATATAGSTINWYTAPSGGVSVGTGSNFVTPELSATTNYYVAANDGGTTATVGATYSGSNTNDDYVGSHGIVITTTSPNIVIVSAKIPFTGKGSFTIQLQTTAGAVVSTVTTPEIVGGGSVPVVVPLNIQVSTPGTYRLLVTAVTGTIYDLGYIDNPTFPYTAFAGAFSITSGFWYSNDADNNLYLFNLQVTNTCESSRTLVTATVTSPPALTLNATAATICSGSSASINVTSPAGNFATYSWSPATGVAAGGTPSGTTNLISPTTTTNYTLTATSASNCVNKITTLITVNPAPPVTTGATVCSGSNATITSSTTCTGFGNASLTITGSWNATTDATAPRPIIYIANSTVCDFDPTVIRNYVKQDFQVTVTGTYTFVMPATTSFDGMGYIVTGPFVPGNCSGGGSWIVGDDDSGPTLFEPMMSATLTAGVTYTLITTTYSSTSGTVTDNFTWNITGPAGGAVTTPTTGNIQWWTAATGGTLLGTGSPFNPVGVSGSGFPTNTTVGTQTYYAACANNNNCRTATTYTINATGQWIGGTSTAWSNVLNWCGGVPTNTTDVIISTGVPNMPLLSTGVGTVRNLSVGTGASLTVNNATLQIGGSISANNNIIATNGTIELNGAVAQSISGSSFSGRTLKNLIAGNSVNVSSTPNDSMRITGTLSFGNVNSKLFNSGDNVILVSNAAGTARIADITNGGINSGNSISGKFVVQRYIPARRAWRLLTAPIAAGAQTINQAWQEGVGGNWALNPNPGYGTHITGGTSRTTAQGFDQGPLNSSIYSYSGSAWNVIPATTSELVSSKQGFMLFIRGSRAINLPASSPTTLPDNTILRPTGAVKFGLQPAVTGSGFTVVGNPYPSAINFNNVTRSGVIGGVGGNAYYVWDPSLGGAYGQGAFITFSWNGTDYDKNIGPSNIDSNGIISSGAAFMVNLNAGGSITFNESSKAADGSGTSYLFRPNGSSSKLRTTLYALNANSAPAPMDGNLITFHPESSNDANDEDAVKANNFAENFAVLRQGIKIAIERRQPVVATDTLQYAMWNMKQKSYRIECTLQALDLPPGHDAIMEDTYLGTQTILANNGTTNVDFAVTADPASAASNRFRIVFATSVVLPVRFVQVTATKQGKDVAVEWKVANELNLQGYSIEKSTDGIHFTAVGNSIAANGSHLYNGLDVQPATGHNYYRIKSIDLNGSIQYSNIVKVLISKPLATFTVVPNPVRNNMINIAFENAPTGVYEATLYNSAGQLILSQSIKHIAGNTTEEVRPNQLLATGTYQLELINKEGNKQTIAVVVE